MARIRNLLGFLSKYFTVTITINILTVVTAISLTYFKIVPQDSITLLKVILLSIGILFISHTTASIASVNRDQRIQQLSNQIEIILDQKKFPNLIVDRLTSDTSLDEILQKATSIDMMGISLWDTVQKKSLMGRIENGLHCRLILTDCRCLRIANKVAEQFYEVGTPDQAREDVIASLKKLRKLQESLRDQRPKAKGSLRYKLLGYMPPVGILIYEWKNGDISENWFGVELYTYRQDKEVRPIIRCKSLRDPERFRIFQEQFNTFWEDAKIDAPKVQYGYCDISIAKKKCKDYLVCAGKLGATE
jgi:hypothetical protein